MAFSNISTATWKSSPFAGTALSAWHRGYRAHQALARNGDVSGLRANVGSAASFAAFIGLNPARQPSAMRAFVEADGLCEARSPRPLASPKPVDAHVAEGQMEFSNARPTR